MLWICAMVLNARKDQHRGECQRPRAIGGGGGGPQQPAKACLAGADHSGDGRGLWHGPDHAPAAISKPCVWRWQERFMREGVASLLRDKTRKPGLPPLPPAVIDRVVELTLAEPPDETTHWTGRAMAAASGISLRSVQRIWAAHGLQPHRVRRFKLSQDPAFAAKLSGSISIRQPTVWCTRSTRTHKFRRSTAPNPACR
jgi:Homeodomain-like domain